MQPQEIVEEEELERLKALLQRENLIRSMGIVEQITSMVHPSHRDQKKLHEHRVRVAVQHIAQQGTRAVHDGGYGPRG